jgi:hypothetical protein
METRANESALCGRAFTPDALVRVRRKASRLKPAPTGLPRSTQSPLCAACNICLA